MSSVYGDEVLCLLDSLSVSSFVIFVAAVVRVDDERLSSVAEAF